jgi:hypothetical protein
MKRAKQDGYLIIVKIAALAPIPSAGTMRHQQA